MTSVQIYHNPRCSKSRQTLALLEENGHTPEVILYLEHTPDADTLRQLIDKLGLARAHDLVRTKEADYANAGLSKDSDDARVIDAMQRYPKLIERPIVVNGNKAAIGRPPENVLAIL